MILKDLMERDKLAMNVLINVQNKNEIINEYYQKTIKGKVEKVSIKIWFSICSITESVMLADR